MAEFQESIEIAASPETVFEYLTTTDGMTSWMGPFADLDQTPGGRFAVSIAGHQVQGEYLHVECPNRTVHSWGFAGNDGLPAGSSTVEFRLIAICDGTRVKLRHFDLPDTKSRGHAGGWTNFLPSLAIAAAGGDPGPDSWHPLPAHANTTATNVARRKENS